MAQQLNTNTFTSATWIVNSDATKGTHTTLAGALTSASSGDTIFLQTSVTENVTLKAGVNIFSYPGAELRPQVSITGKCTFTTAGTVTISGIQLITNSDFFLAVTGTVASIVYLENCYLNMSNNTGITYTSSSASSAINIIKCDGTFGTTGITLCVSTASGNVLIEHSNIFYGSASSTATSTSTAQIIANHSQFNFPFSTSTGGSLNFHHCNIACNNQSATCITTAGTGTSTADLCILLSSSASAVSIGSGTTLNLFGNEINSSNTNAITGAGTVVYSGLSYGSTSPTINTTTQTARLTSNFSKIVVQTFTGSGTYTPTTGMKYCIVEAVGGGGGGAGCPAAGAATVAAGGGGGGSGYGRRALSAAQVGASQTVTIGTGGAGGTGNAAGSAGVDSTFGALVTGGGGGGGANAGAAATVLIAGGAGGGGGAGDFVARGGAGGNGIGFTVGNTVLGGTGGGSIFGGAREAVSGGNGNTGNAYGGGGGGACGTNNAAAANGGTGGAGIIVVTEYL